ncbi:hypothetical protein K8I61_11610 [bacterium]|nr:hypothetical protein [bacterium]
MSKKAMWKKPDASGFIPRLRRIAELVETIQREYLAQEMQRIEGMAKTAAYFRPQATGPRPQACERSEAP